MSDEVLRPGVALGPYPERNEPRPGRLDRTATRAFAAIRGGPHRLPALQRVAKQVRTERKKLRSLGEEAIARRLAEVRRQLFRSGPTDEIAIPAFGLVCEYARRVLGMDPYDVQVMGGYAILQGVLAEMQTGEGKTLTATLPACTAALAGIPVHVITVNDYLVTRDAELMRPLYSALGLTVGTVVDADAEPASRRAAYAADITYVTNKQIAFDYLRDRGVRGDRGATLRLEMLSRGASNELLLRGLCYAIVDEADSVLVDEARTPLILSQTVESSDLERISDQALELASALKEGEDFDLDIGRRSVSLTDDGEARLEEMVEDWEGIWCSGRRRGELIHQALQALHLFRRDSEYLVREGKVMIVDASTGRVMPDRSWEMGLHQMVEAKEGVELSGQRKTLARISYQQFYQRYLRLGGMTGTAQEVRGEMFSVYGLQTVRIPTHRPVQRVGLPDTVFCSGAEKWDAVVKRAAAVQWTGRPVLIGTGTVAESEALSERLNALDREHLLLNARFDSEEAEIISGAGEANRLTIATNMAGRGTDIALGEGVREAGGLHVIAVGRADASRIDRQLYGRSGRQGDPGSYELMASLEDDIVTATIPPRIREWIAVLLRRFPQAAAPLGRKAVLFAQRRTERRHARQRKQLLKMEEQLEASLAFSGPAE